MKLNKKSLELKEKILNHLFIDHKGLACKRKQIIIEGTKTSRVNRLLHIMRKEKEIFYSKKYWIISPEIYRQMKEKNSEVKLCSLCSKLINVNENRGIGFRGNGILVHTDCEEKEGKL